MNKGSDSSKVFMCIKEVQLKAYLYYFNVCIYIYFFSMDGKLQLNINIKKAGFNINKTLGARNFLMLFLKSFFILPHNTFFKAFSEKLNTRS